MSENVIQSLHKKSGFSIDQGLTGFDYKGWMVETPCTFYLTLTMICAYYIASIIGSFVQSERLLRIGTIAIKKGSQA